MVISEDENHRGLEKGTEIVRVKAKGNETVQEKQRSTNAKQRERDNRRRPRRRFKAPGP
jgi:hypothetical protein